MVYCGTSFTPFAKNLISREPGTFLSQEEHLETGLEMQGSDNELRAQRLRKLDELREANRDPFAVERVERTHRSHEVSDLSASHWSLQDEDRAALRFVIVGRITAHRWKGKVVFADTSDESGRLQVYVRRDDVGEELFDEFCAYDLGDYVEASGYPFITRTGEPTLHVMSFRMVSKALRSVPIGKTDSDGVVHGGLTDLELRYRSRYLDLLANPDARDVLVKRCKIVTAMRRFLDEQGFLDVETPVLQVEAGGAAARPFLTHHNALNYDLKLRISLELFLKRLIIGGIEKVYEIGRVFRNEGVSTRHNPEFTLMELYQAYANLEDIMELVENMYEYICQQVNGSSIFQYGEREIDLSKRPWRRLPMLDGIQQYAGIAPDELRTMESAIAACRRIGVPFHLESETTLGGLIEKLHEQYTQPNLIEPTFITDFPVETSPLAKRRQDDTTLARRFEIYIACQELGNAFSELNDPLEQRLRFEGQMAQRAAGDAEAHPMDEDFVEAMEYGMPPTGGLGVGLDRLALVLTGAESIRDVILFPLMRPNRRTPS